MFLRRSVAFCLAAALLIVGAFVSVRTLALSSGHSEWITRQQAEYSQLRRLLSAMRDAETGQRGFAIAQQTRFLEPYISGLLEARTDLAGVEQSFRGRYPRQIHELAGLVERQIVYLEENVRLTRGGQGQAVILAAAQGKANMDRIRALVNEISVSEAATLAQRRDHLRRTIDQAIATVCVSFFLALLVCGAAIGKMLADLRFREAAEEALRAGQEGLEERVAERTRELAESNERLQGMVRALDRESERRNSLQQELWISNQRFQSAFENAAIGMAQTAPDGRFVLVNRRFCEVLGYSEEQILTRSFLDLTHPDDAEENERLAHSLWAGEIPFYSRRKRYLRSDGRPIWVAVTVSVIRDSAGEPQYYIGAVQEIEKEMEAERQLMESETRYRFLADSMPQIVFTARSDGSIDYYNQRWVEYTGMTAEETFVAGWEIVVHPDDLEQCKEKWGLAVRTGMPYQCEYRFRRARDGEYRWHLGRALPQRDAQGRITRWIGACTDIDDQKAAENKVRSLNESLERRVADRANDLAKSEERFRSLVEGVKDYAILMLDSLGRVCNWTEGAARIHGYSAEQVLGKHFSIFYPDEDKRAGRPYANLRTALHDGTFEQESWRLRSDGSRFWASVLITALRNEDGSLRGYSKIVRDVSERRRAGELIEKKTAELETMNANLLALSQRAEQASEAKTNFLAAMSHEIRTPMNAILGMADLLWESKLDGEQRRYVDVFRRAGNNLLSLINDILDLSKIESGNFELEQIPFNISEVFDRTMELIEPRARAKNLELVSRFSVDLQTVLVGDPVRLQQILVNLLGNAVKFTEKGRIVLTAKPDTAGAGRIFLSVSDTGIGIAADKLEHIFDDFTQADSSTTRRFGGTGLGLGICKRLVARMGGELKVESNPGLGSTFSFSALFGTGEQQRRVAPRALADFHGQRVLIVDDNPTNRLIVRETLTSWGLTTGECATAAEGVAELERAASTGNQYGLILLDSHMPEAGGFEAVAAVRGVAPNVPIVMLTSDSQPGDATRCQEFNLAGYAVKPVARPELLRLICSALAVADEKRPTPHSAGEVRETRGALTPMKLLIAEDSPDNRILLEAYLKTGPYEITFAENGQLAAERFETGRYDLVLMDMQMPVMDGLSATRRMRSYERARGRAATPILALTANALQRDVESALEAGCNSHLSKPISKSKLIGAIEEWVQRDGASHQEPACEIDVPPGLEEYARKYIESRRGEMATFNDLYARSDFQQMRALAHNIKGTGASYGFPELTRLGSELEDLAKRSDAPAIGEQLAALSRYLTKASQAVQSIAPATEDEYDRQA